MKFRKKPVTIEAVRWDGTVESVKKIRALNPDGRDINTSTLHDTPYLEIKTLEGVMRANLGDYIIQGVKGEIYPCKPDIFEATYEAV